MQTVLIVDDIAENLYYLEMLLKGNGFEVRSAINGVDALESARKTPPDLIISDILMPVMDGYMLCREWRSDGQLKQIPFIFYTATFVEKKDEQLALDLGADRFVIKPQEPETLLMIIHDLFAKYAEKNNFPATITAGNEKELLADYGEALYRKLIKKMADLENINTELHKKSQEIEQFIYTVSHDLRSPLVTIKTFTGYVKEDIKNNNSERITQDLQFINSAADKMKILLDELLEMSRIGRIENPAIEISFREIVAQTLEILAGLISEHKVEIIVDETDLTLLGDRILFCKIWENLIENAIKYSCKDRPSRIELGFNRMDREVIFFVRDNGIGIEPAYHNKIFGMFEKLDPKSDGIGLGLSMVKRAVESHGGNIRVESNGSGEGSCFYFSLPRSVVQV